MYTCIHVYTIFNYMYTEYRIQMYTIYIKHVYTIYNYMYTYIHYTCIYTIYIIHYTKCIYMYKCMYKAN